MNRSAGCWGDLSVITHCQDDQKSGCLIAQGNRWACQAAKLAAPTKTSNPSVMALVPDVDLSQYQPQYSTVNQGATE